MTPERRKLEREKQMIYIDYPTKLSSHDCQFLCRSYRNNERQEQHAAFNRFRFRRCQFYKSKRCGGFDCLDEYTVVYFEAEDDLTRAWGLSL